MEVVDGYLLVLFLFLFLSLFTLLFLLGVAEFLCEYVSRDVETPGAVVERVVVDRELVREVLASNRARVDEMTRVRRHVDEFWELFASTHWDDFIKTSYLCHDKTVWVRCFGHTPRELRDTVWGTG